MNEQTKMFKPTLLSVPCFSMCTLEPKQKYLKNSIKLDINMQQLWTITVGKYSENMLGQPYVNSTYRACAQSLYKRAYEAIE